MTINPIIKVYIHTKGSYMSNSNDLWGTSTFLISYKHDVCPFKHQNVRNTY